MAKQQLKLADGAKAFPCAVCKKPFTDRSNRRHHMIRFHPNPMAAVPVAARSATSTSSSISGLNLRHTVSAVTGELLQSNFTKPADDLVAAVRSMAPSLSAREAEILLAATSTAVKHTASMFQTLDSLRRAGGPAGPAEKDITRQVAYLTVGPRWPRSAPNDDAASLSSGSSPVVTNRTDLVNSWLADHPQAPIINASSGFAMADGVALPELAGDTGVIDAPESITSLPPPPPLPPFSASSAASTRVMTMDAATETTDVRELDRARSRSPSRHRSRPSTPAGRGDRRRYDHHRDDRRRRERREPRDDGDRDRRRR